MGGSTKIARIGIIAEEKNDVEVMYELTCKIIRENKFTFSHFLGHGCGKVRRKCYAWAKNLLERGCSYLVILHDLDQRDEAELRDLLEAEISDLNFVRTIILIPIEELEAWLLSDAAALKKVFNMRREPNLPKNPEVIRSPKEFLKKIVQDNCKGQYINTVHNRRIAREITLPSLAKCRSFSSYPEFLRKSIS